MNKKKISVAAILLALLLAFAGCSPAGSGGTAPPPPAGGGTTPPADGGAAPEEEAVSLVLAGVANESVKQAIDRFIEIVEAESGGSISIQNFPDNQLGADRVVVESTMMGDIDIVIASTSPIAALYSDFYLFDAPYLFLDYDQAHRALDSAIGQQLLEGLSGIGMKGMFYLENGFRVLSNNQIPARVPEDMSGLIVRTMENEVHIAAWNVFGANPTPMAFAEVFTALQLGTIHGQENPIGGVYANQLYEVQQYISMTNHVYTPFFVAMNLDRWNSLSQAQQSAIQAGIDFVVDYQRQVRVEHDDHILQRFDELGVTVVHPTLEELAMFQNLIAESDVWELVRTRMSNPHLLDDIVALLS